MGKKNKKKKEMSNGVRIGVFTFIIIIVISLIGFGAYKLLADSSSDEKPKALKKNEVVISGYGIYIDDSDTDLYREEFNKLRDNLEGGSINYDEYAASVARLFIIDLYTIKNKINKYDIGGVDFVYSGALDNYKDNVTDTIYKYVEDNTNGDRTQQLPVVKSITVNNVEKSKYKIESENKEYDSYKFRLSWSYSADLGYDTTGEIIVINKDNKMYVVEKN